MSLLIRGARLLDPATGLDRTDDLYVEDGRIAAIGEAPARFAPDTIVDGAGQLLIPGLVDLQTRLREPGEERKGTIASETRAAAAGGVTTLCCPPDTDPVLDTAAVAEEILSRAEAAGHARVLPLGALTRRLRGEQLAEMHALREAGCVAMSNADRPLPDTLVMRRALEYAATLGLTVFLRSEDPWLSQTGCMHEGRVSSRLGLAGIPECAEVIGVARDLVLVEQTGVRAHFSRLSSARAVELVAEAQARGVPVTCDVSAHQLFLTEMDVGLFDSLCHVRPPLRTQRDRDGLRAALADGVIGAVCSDHQPHDRDAKLAPFAATEPGISALETLLPLVLRLAGEGVLELGQAVAAVTSGPAKVLGIDAGSLRVGAPADLCLVDPRQHWSLDPDALVSHGKNTPFGGWEFDGQVVCTVLGGRVVHRSERLKN